MAVYQFSFVFIKSWDLRDHRDRVVSIADLNRLSYFSKWFIKWLILNQDSLTKTAWKELVDVLPVLSCLVVTSQPLLPGTTLSTWRESWSTCLSYIFIKALCTWVLNCMYLWRRCACAYCSKYSSTWVSTLWSKMFHPSSTTSTNLWMMKEWFLLIGKREVWEGHDLCRYKKSLEDKSSSPLLEG